MTVEPFLVFDGLVRHFGPVRVLPGVDGSVGPGEVLLVKGPNGSGKSTLLRCLAGLIRPQEGTIRFRLGTRELDAWARRLEVGYVAPDLAFYEPLTARENLHFFSRIRSTAPRSADELAERLGVPPDRLVAALSSGQCQRLRWAWALLHAPPLLLLDEPFQNLDREGEEVVREVLADHRGRGGAVVVASPGSLELDGVTEVLDLAALPEGAPS